MAVRCQTRSDLEAYGVALAILGGILAVLAFGAAMAAHDGELPDAGELMMIAVLGAAYLLLAGWVALRIREWLALGDAVVRFSPSRPRAGESFTCSIAFTRPPAGTAIARGELICQKTTSTGIGDKKKSRTATLWRDAKNSSTLQFSFHPPANLPGAENSAGTEVRWWLRVRSPGWNGFRRRFRLPLRRAAAAGESPLPPGEYESSSLFGEPSFSRAFKVLYGISALLFAATVGLLAWGFGDAWLVDESAAERVEGRLRLGELRHGSLSSLTAQLEGSYAWRPGSLQVRADSLRMRAWDCEGPCPRIEEIRLSLWHWAEGEGGGASGTTVARTEPIAIGLVPQEGFLLDLGARAFALKLRRDADPRQLSLMLDVRTDKGERQFGQRFGGAAHLFGLFQAPGDARTCAGAKTAVTALEHFCQGRFAEMLSDVPAAERSRLLFLAIQRGNVAAVRALVAAEASISALDHRKHTPLMVAAFADQPEILAILLEAGADPNFVAKASAGEVVETALGLALTAGAMRSVRVLLEKGANAQAMHRESPMVHVAIAADLPEALPLLAKHGADVNARASWGDQPTPLMIAAGTGKTALMSQLLELGADPALGDADGHTARDYAATHRRRDALERLKGFPGRCPLTGCG